MKPLIFILANIIVLGEVLGIPKNPPPEPIDWYDCSGKEPGRYMHTIDCTKYIICDQEGNAFQRKCPSCIHIQPHLCPHGRLVFNDEEKVCFPAGLAKCKIAPWGPEPPNSSTTTVSPTPTPTTTTLPTLPPNGTTTASTPTETTTVEATTIETTISTPTPTETTSEATTIETTTDPSTTTIATTVTPPTNSTETYPPTTTEPPPPDSPLPGDECDFEECVNFGYGCQTYLRCDKDSQQWIVDDCGDDLYWNPVNPNGTEQVHGGNCDLLENISPEILEKYKNDPECDLE